MTEQNTGGKPTPIANSPLARKLGSFVRLTNAELAALNNLHNRRRRYVAERDVIHEGQRDQAAYVLARGWVASYKVLPDGTRQIVDFQIPGDFLGLRSVLLRTSDQQCRTCHQDRGVGASKA